MPIFEYRCEDCGTKFEKLMRRAGEAAPGCPSCGGEHADQQFSTFSARANGAPVRAEAPAACPSGRCGNPGMCGMN
ncbi:MAG: zinc ribbon domain-containing protein [Bryobacterales bacterium]|nr:zinc ribbon domain-containing protein [Bryobacterales bacterium]